MVNNINSSKFAAKTVKILEREFLQIARSGGKLSILVKYGPHFEGLFKSVLSDMKLSQS
jgi:hypothetical protein